MEVRVTSLDQRIADAFGSRASSEAIAGLISEVQAAASEASGKAEEARSRALDPALSGQTVATARREMDDAAFVRDRMATAAERLGLRLKEVRHLERERRRQARYEIARTCRDHLAKELAETYPPLAAKLLILLSELAGNDRDIERINERDLPSGAERLLTAEMLARGLLGFRQRGLDVPSIVRAVRLPAFEFEPNAPFSWPPSQTRRTPDANGRTAPLAASASV